MKFKSSTSKTAGVALIVAHTLFPVGASAGAGAPAELEQSPDRIHEASAIWLERVLPGGDYKMVMVTAKATEEVGAAGTSDGWMQLERGRCKGSSSSDKVSLSCITTFSRTHRIPSRALRIDEATGAAELDAPAYGVSIRWEPTASGPVLQEFGCEDSPVPGAGVLRGSSAEGKVLDERVRPASVHDAAYVLTGTCVGEL